MNLQIPQARLDGTGPRFFSRLHSSRYDNRILSRNFSIHGYVITRLNDVFSRAEGWSNSSKGNQTIAQHGRACESLKTKILKMNELTNLSCTISKLIIKLIVIKLIIYIIIICYIIIYYIY